jgi:hypothetical protein
VPCLLADGRSILPSPSEAMGNSSAEFPVMVHGGDGGLLRVEPMMIAYETSPEGERLMPPKKLAMNSILPKRMVSLREKPSHDKR